MIGFQGSGLAVSIQRLHSGIACGCFIVDSLRISVPVLVCMYLGSFIIPAALSMGSRSS